MLLVKNTDVPEGASMAVFKTSSLAAGLVALVFVTGSLVLGFLALYMGRSLPGLAQLALAPVLLLGALLGLVVDVTVLQAWYATFLRSNWVMKVGRGGVWLQLRSPLNHTFLERDATALFVPFEEIQSAGRVSEQRRGLDTESQTTVRTLELRVTLDTEPVAEALRVERKREAPQRTFLGIKSRGRSLNEPVFVPDPGILRVEWHGRRMLRVLQENGVAGAPDRKAAGPWSRATLETADDRVVALIERGEKIEAIKLLRQTHGMRLAEAKAFVEDLIDQAA